MSTPNLTPVQELRDCVELLLRAVGEHYLALVAPTTLKRTKAILERTKES